MIVRVMIASLICLVAAESNTTDQSDDVKLSEGELVGIIIGSIVITCMFLLCAGFLVVYILIEYRNKPICNCCCCKETYRPPANDVRIVTYPSYRSNNPEPVVPAVPVVPVVPVVPAVPVVPLETIVHVNVV